MILLFIGIKSFFKKLIGMGKTIKQANESLINNSKRSIASLHQWIKDINENENYGNNSDYSAIKNREYYYHSVEQLQIDGMKLTFEWAGEKIIIKARTLPVKNAISFDTYRHIPDLSDVNLSNSKLEKIEGLNNIYNVGNSNTWREFAAAYFDSIVDHFKSNQQ
jgi:hypothetical protein